MRLMTIRTEADDGRPADCVYGRSDSLCAYGLLARSAAVSAAAAVRVAGGPTTDGAKERERETERERERGSIWFWDCNVVRNAPAPLTTETGAAAAAAAEDAYTTVVDLAFDLASPPLSFHFHCGSRTVRKQGATRLPPLPRCRKK